MNDDAGFGIEVSGNDATLLPPIPACVAFSLGKCYGRGALILKVHAVRYIIGTWMAITYKEPICYDVCTRMLLLWLAV